MTQLEDRQFTECPPMAIDPTRQYIATLRPSRGDCPGGFPGGSAYGCQQFRLPGAQRLV
jgi:hypothetical protein